MLAFAGLIGYTAISAYHRQITSRKLLNKLDTNDYNHVIVIYQSHLLCPNLKATVVGFKDRYITENEKIRLIEHAFTQNNRAELVDNIMSFKNEALLEANAVNIAFGGTHPDDIDGKLIHAQRVWVFPSIMPGGISRINYKRDISTNELKWDGSARSWADVKNSTVTETKSKTTNECGTETYTSKTTTIYSLSTPPP
jgi:hypothetical protein